jgi:hypothetical protein
MSVSNSSGSEGESSTSSRPQGSCWLFKLTKEDLVDLAMDCGLSLSKKETAQLLQLDIRIHLHCRSAGLSAPVSELKDQNPRPLLCPLPPQPLFT